MVCPTLISRYRLEAHPATEFTKEIGIHFTRFTVGVRAIFANIQAIQKSTREVSAVITVQLQPSN